MTRFRKIFFLIGTSALMMAGCRPNRGSANPEDYYPLIQLSIEGGKIAAMIGRNQAIERKDFAGCVASDVVAAAMDSANTALSAKISDTPTIPGFSLDLKECLSLRGSAPGGDRDAGSLVEAISGVALVAARHYATKLQASNCKKGSLALAVVDFVSGMVVPISEEIAQPDGKISVPDVPVKFTCSDDAHG